MVLAARPATQADVPDVVALQSAYDVGWFGAEENDEGEVRESFDRVDPLADRSLLLHDEGRLVAAAWWWRPSDSTLLADPTVDQAGIYEELVPWLGRSGAEVAEALDRDVVLRAALEGFGWHHVRSQFELMRDASDLPPVGWPEGVTTTGMDGHARVTHQLVYEEAGWAEVPGHERRDFEEWYGLFVAKEDPEQQVLAWQDGRLVGVALGRTFSDGIGWVSQVAVPRDLRRRGLGRALILEAFGRRLAGGATGLGLGVSAANAGALRLYLDLGLVVDREWMVFAPPT